MSRAWEMGHFKRHMTGLQVQQEEKGAGQNLASTSRAQQKDNRNNLLQYLCSCHARITNSDRIPVPHVVMRVRSQTLPRVACRPRSWVCFTRKGTNTEIHPMLVSRRKNLPNRKPKRQKP